MSPARAAGVAALIALAGGAAGVSAQVPQRSPLLRRYRDGEAIHYRMEATNQHGERLVRYAAEADGRVERDSLGRWVEVLEWSHLVRNDSAVRLPAGTDSVRQRLSLAQEFAMPPAAPPAAPELTGPALDLLTFYIDLWVAAKLPLYQAGGHFAFPGRGANSWADGKTLVIAEDAIDFDFTLTALDTAAGVARLTVRHVPPGAVRVRLPAEWMQVPAFGSPNNWVQVTRASDTSWVASVGRETFDVRLTVSLSDGRLQAAEMENPVDVLERTCRDEALTSCGDALRYRILRHIAVR